MSEHKYYYIQNYSSHGEMAINHHAFETIALNAIKKIDGVKIFKRKSKRHLYHPVTCEMGKNGKVKIKVNVSLKRNADIKKTCETIQEEIANAILLAVETLHVDVNINVAAIND